MVLDKDEALRPIKDGDLPLVLEWRNHPSVREYMYTRDVITVKEHLAWYKSACGDPSRDLLLFEISGTPMGFVQFTRWHQIDVAEWGFYTSPGAQKGTGRRLGRASLLYAFEVLNLRKLCGQAISNNARSIALHQSLGFRKEGQLREHYYDGTSYLDILLFGLCLRQWKEAHFEENHDTA